MDERVDNENVSQSAGTAQTPERAPFTFGSVLSGGFSCFKENFKMLLLLVLVVTLPMAIVQVFMIDRNFDYAGTMNTFMELYSASTEEAEAGAAGDASGLAWKLLLYLGLTALISSVSLITEAGALVLVGRKYGYLKESGEPVMGAEPVSDRNMPGFSALFEMAFRIFPKLWLTMLFVRFSVFMGLMLCFVPGILLYYVFQFAAFSVVFCGLWGRKAGFVSSLATRVYPKPSLFCALLFFAAAGLMLPTTVSVLASLPAQFGLDNVTSGIITVVLRCGEQLVVLLFTMMAATLFIGMLPKLEPLIESSGARNSKIGR